MAATVLINNIPMPIHYQDKLVVDRHSTADIITLILQEHNRYKPQYDKIAPSFWKGSAEATAKNLYKFLKDNIQTVTESADVQTVKSPARFIADGHGDCKHYTSFVCGVVDALARAGYPISCKYRFTADRPGAPVHHVFSVIDTAQGERWLDGILSGYDVRNKFYNIKDYPMLYSISGSQVGKWDPFTRNRDMHPNRGLKLLDKAKNVTLKVSLSTARNAFLALVKINMFNLARRLDMAIQSPATSEKTKRIWRNLGGDVTALQKSIEVGRAKPMIGSIYENSYIGTGEPVSTTTLITLATAVLAAFTEVLKTSNKEKNQIAEAVPPGINNLLTDLVPPTPGAQPPVTGGLTTSGNTGTLTIEDVPALRPNNKADRFSDVAIVDNPGAQPPGKKFSTTLTEVWDNYKTPITVISLGLLTAAGYKYFLTTQKKR